MTIDHLFDELRSAKAKEAEAKAERIEVEQRILALVEDAPDNGSRTLKGERGRISVKFGLSYKADIDALREIEGAPLKFVPAKYELDAKAYEAMREADQAAFAKVAQFVTVKPKKPGVSLKA